MTKYDSIIHLIKISNKTNSTIICNDKNEIIKIKAIAKSINIYIKNPKTIKELHV